MAISTAAWGVACDISGVGEWKEADPGYFTYSCGYMSSGNIAFEDKDIFGLPVTVTKYYGLPHRAWLIRGRCIADLNDGYTEEDERVCLSHPEIAKVIRAWLEEQVVED